MKKASYLFFVFFLTVVTHRLQAQDAIALYKEGLELKTAKKISEAADKFKEAIALEPAYTEALYENGWCQNDLKNYYAAIESLRKARVGWDHIPKVHFELGYAFDKTNSTDSAIKEYTRCLELKPDYSGAQRQLGYIAYIKEDYVTALDRFKKYEAVADPITDYLYWYRKGFMLNAQKDYNGAKTALKRSLEFKKDYINTWLEIGFASKNLKESDEAIGYYNEAMKLDPKSYIPYNAVGEVYRDNKKDVDEAMNWYKKSLDLKPRERKASFGMGYCLNSKGQYNDAIPYLKTAVAEEGTYTAAYVELGYSYYMTSDNTNALYNLNNALSLNPKNENARYYSGLVYIMQKNKSMAQKMVDELRALSSRYSDELQKKVDAM